jgi:hypothetical protein
MQLARATSHEGRTHMPRRPSSTTGAWTAQQRLFLALAVVLCLVALGICAVRLQPSSSPPDPADSVQRLATVSRA